MTEHADLLVEIGCEELPPKALDAIRDAFFNSVKAGLEKCGISFNDQDSRAFSSPRRLALLLRGVASQQDDQLIERRGPAIQAAFDADGKPTRAAEGFARSVGKTVKELETLATEKGEFLYCRVHQAGKSLDELLYPVLEQAIRQLPVPKPMRWADHDFSFVRPVHWLVVLYGKRVLQGELLGQAAGKQTRGHRIHSPGPHDIENAADYLEVLEMAFVLADQDERKSRIQGMLQAADEQVTIDPGLLDEVNNLVEWPSAVKCTFEEVFLEVPHAALVASMQDHQKFFPVSAEDGSDAVSNRFVAISNIDSLDVEAVRQGYERVIRPRLADARFFLEQDQKTPLEDRLPALDRVVFQQKIGSVGDKSRRISVLSAHISDLLGVADDSAKRAALLCKCDLLTQMVGEFPELQGLMGRYYAKTSGESDAVADAIGEHYAPRFSGDDIPASTAGRIVSIADRLDTLVGIFAAGMKPSGNKDPFALRRAALGLLRILLEARLELSLEKLISLSFDEIGVKMGANRDVCEQVYVFIVDRLRHFYTEKGYQTELVNAVLASDWSSLPDLDKRLMAIHHFMDEPAARSLAAANKRIGNILRKSEIDGKFSIDADRLILAQEKHLFEEVSRIEQAVTPLLENGDYENSLNLLSELEQPVNDFFDAVMVMDEDPVLRENRLAILDRLKFQFDRIADLSVLG